MKPCSVRCPRVAAFAPWAVSKLYSACKRVLLQELPCYAADPLRRALGKQLDLLRPFLPRTFYKS